MELNKLREIIITHNSLVVNGDGQHSLSTKNIILRVVVPYFEGKYDNMGAVGKAVFSELKHQMTAFLEIYNICLFSLSILYAHTHA